ncbi:uncharacterized protein LOC144231864 [Crocuta crocuta]
MVLGVGRGSLPSHLRLESSHHQTTASHLGSAGQKHWAPEAQRSCRRVMSEKSRHANPTQEVGCHATKTLRQPLETSPLHGTEPLANSNVKRHLGSRSSSPSQTLHACSPSQHPELQPHKRS